MWHTIPDWANGVCQRCLMLEQEGKHFGTNRVQPSDDTQPTYFLAVLPSRASDT